MNYATQKLLRDAQRYKGLSKEARTVLAGVLQDCRYNRWERLPRFTTQRIHASFTLSVLESEVKRRKLFRGSPPDSITQQQQQQ